MCQMRGMGGEFQGVLFCLGPQEHEQRKAERLLIPDSIEVPATGMPSLDPGR
jgi:hypothetical protein